MELKHGINQIWDMEINEYDNIYLSEMYDDTTIEILKQFGSEDLFPYISIIKNGSDMWIGKIEVSLEYFSYEDIKKELEYIKEKYSNYRSFLYKNKKEIEINILLTENHEIIEAKNEIEIYADLFLDHMRTLQNKSVSRLARSYILKMLPIYQRAMKKVKMELENFITDSDDNKGKIVDICGRVKTLESICEKVNRKGIGQFEVFDKFEDIAGVRCTCEYLDDVREVMEYINKNQLFNVSKLEDKIEKPTQEGYRGIHIIVLTKVYYQGKIYDNIKVEIQLRTSFQNAWSMKTHQLTYKKDTVESNSIKNVMKELSDVLKEADETALKMKNITKR